MKRKNLNDVIYGDRADIRQYQHRNDEDWIDFGGSGKKTYTERCYHPHPPLPLPNSDFVIYGGSCSSPVITDADIYIGLCHSMRQTAKRFPWEVGEEVYFPIPDMGVPQDVDDFKALVGWTKSRIEFGFKVHVGCIGGHGRTGTLLAALVSLYGEKDAIQYVRQHYCPKAVETEVQVQFLVKHFGINPMDGYKEKKQRQPVSLGTGGIITITPVESALAIW